MSGSPQLDGRRARALEAELLRRAQAVLSGDGRNPPGGPIARAIFGVAARIGEEVIGRLDRAPAKQVDNFYTAAGIGRDPARAATVPVALKLVEGATQVLSAPAQLQFMVDTGGPVFFETETRIDLAPGTIAALRGVDAAADAITIPSGSFMAAGLPRADPLARRLRSGAAAGAVKLQIDPSAGLAPGMLLRIGEGEAARDYEAIAVEGDLVTIEPPLETGLAQDASVFEVSDFAPFASVTRNHQSHFLYVGHASLLDVPSAVTITVSGADLPEGTVWSWWGKVGEDDPPAWHALTRIGGGGGLRFEKEEGKPAKTKIRDRESLWLRAELPGKSAASAQARDLRLAIGGGKMCGADQIETCTTHLHELNVDFEAVANTTALVTNVPFRPFGLEPRLFDSFYIGSDEAFSKAGAQIALCFRFAGATLGQLRLFEDNDATRLFGVGADGLLYRLQLTPAPAGTGGQTSADLRPVPPPSAGSAAALLQSQSPLAHWRSGAAKMVAVAGQGTIHVAELQAGPDVSTVKWLGLPLPGKEEVVSLATHGGANGVVLYALQKSSGPSPGPRLFSWDGVAAEAAPTSYTIPVRDLMEIDGQDAVLTVEQTTATQIDLVRRDAGGLTVLGSCAAADLPTTGLRAAADRVRPGIYYIVGYDSTVQGYELRLVRIDASSAVVQIDPKEAISLSPFAEPLPIGFSPGPVIAPPIEARPILSIATQSPVHVSWYWDGSDIRPAIGREPVPLGASANLHRGFLLSTNYAVVQRPDLGLFYRPRAAGGGIVRDLRLAATEGLLVEASQIPPAAAVIAHFVRGTTALAEDGTILANAGATAGGAHTILRPPGAIFAPRPATGDHIVAYGFHALSDFVANGTGGTIRFDGTTGLSRLALRIDFDGPQAVWTFQRTNTSSDDWPIPTGFPGPLATTWTWRRLDETGRATQWSEAALLANATLLGTLPADLLVWAAEDADATALTLHKYGTGAAAAVVYDLDHIRNNQALFLAAPGRWQAMGPDQPGNPSLSWEYWNGESWWALPADGPGHLTDRTDSFTQDGGVFFDVPPDSQPSEVNGRKRYWLRARLVRGDYGEAKVTVVNRPGAEAGTTEQTVTRDISSIRAPYVTSLRLGYCAQTPVRPEIVLTDDSLGAIDQTSANEAGLEFSVFTPVGELMNPVDGAETAAKAAADSVRCDDPCPPPPGAAGSPCDAPGAYDSCDSPCIAPDGHRRSAAGEAAGFVRGLMLGFARGFAGDTVSLYVDAEPGGLPTELAAEMLRDGRFVPIAVAGDTSYGLTEPGILTLALPVPPDRSDLLGTPAHWLRLRPKRDSANWTPRLRAIHLNAVLARSVETRVMEQLGTSTGLDGQLFRLSEAPVDPDSLVLRVRETLAEEDDPEGRLDVREYPSGLPGTWVRWEVSDDLIEGEEPRRAFLLDAEQGIIRFGDGKAGRIPSLGAELLAETYARVIGHRANGVPPGKQLQLLAPLAGVERATALDFAAGGSDAETLESARRRAPAKVRHGRRILTHADLEDHALTLAPGIAQVRADRKGGAMRLVVVMKGAEARPSPAALRGFAAAIREVAGYGLARPGGLIVVGPRQLPIAIELVLQPRSPDLFAEAAVQARDRLLALFDPATGNHDGKGWPLGRVPDGQDVAAALTPIDALALPVHVTLRRADKGRAAEARLPGTIPSDVLVRLDPNAIAFERSREAAA